jgi:hypothetical protein
VKRAGQVDDGSESGDRTPGKGTAGYCRHLVGVVVGFMQRDPGSDRVSGS